MQKFNIYPSPQWLIVLCGFLCCILGTSITYISGIIHLEILENFDITDVQAALAGSIFNSMFMLSGPIGSLLTNTFSCRVCIITGSGVGLIGFGLTSLTENIYIMYVTYGLIAATGLGNICGRYLVGLAASDHEIDSRLLYFGQFSLIGIFTLFLPFYKNFTIQFLYMTAFGMYTGGVWILQTVIIVELVSLSNLASGFGIVMLCGGLGQLAVPLLAEILEDDNHDNVKDIDLSKAFAVSGSLYISAAILCALTARKPSSKYSSVTNLMLDDEKSTNNVIELNGELEMELFIEKK
ncbi:unnamed protein product [Mytilus coruscus]|uniref:Major facilitator superfamily (MFS) profile domain-containing protein n=1 Tax=Mytilus coruscus TaxID=42192 RepID=A0A6J8AF85_MYTCO|nr:unnamed protein product [Mytilus coruscus]